MKLIKPGYTILETSKPDLPFIISLIYIGFYPSLAKELPFVCCDDVRAPGAIACITCITEQCLFHLPIDFGDRDIE